MHLYQRFAFLYYFVHSYLAYEIGERISTQIRSQHDGFTTSFHDIPIDQMPRFRISDIRRIQVRLPRSEELGSNIRLNPNENLKIAMSFSHNKLLLPWSVIFDATKKVTLNKLTVIFEHDEFELLLISSIDLTFSKKITKLDPHHPSLTAFEIEYKWKGIQDQDIALGIYALFTTSLLLFLVIIWWTLRNSNRHEMFAKNI